MSLLLFCRVIINRLDIFELGSFTMNRIDFYFFEQMLIRLFIMDFFSFYSWELKVFRVIASNVEFVLYCLIVKFINDFMSYDISQSSNYFFLWRLAHLVGFRDPFCYSIDIYWWNYPLNMKISLNRQYQWVSI